MRKHSRDINYISVQKLVTSGLSFHASWRELCTKTVLRLKDRRCWKRIDAIFG
jgi:hypothetical protein